MALPLQLVCDSADVDATTLACAHPVWAFVPPVIPEFDLATGSIVGFAILTLWGGVYAIKKLRRVAD